MSWQGNTFLRVVNFIANTFAKAGDINSEFDNFKGGLEACLLRDGGNSPTANLPMGGLKHTGVGNATERNQYASAGQVSDGSLQYALNNSSADPNYNLSVSPAPLLYATGLRISFIPSFSNTVSSNINLNGLGNKVIKKKTLAGLADLVANDIVSGQVLTVIYDGTFFVLDSSRGELVQASSTLTGRSLAGSGPVEALTPNNLYLSSGKVYALPYEGEPSVVNYNFSATVGSNQLTITLTDGAGSPVSSTSPVIVSTDGTLVQTITAPISITVPNTGTMGMRNGTPARLYVALMFNGTVADLAIYNPVEVDNVVPLGQVVNNYKAATNGTSSSSLLSAASDSPLTLYSGTARTSFSVRYIGYIEITQTTAGTWATAPTAKVKFINNPSGKVVTESINSYLAFAGPFTTGVAGDFATAFTASTGDSVLTRTFTPSNVCNLVTVNAFANVSNSVGSYVGMGLVSSNFTNALTVACMANSGTPLYGGSVAMQAKHLAMQTTAITYTLRTVRPSGNTYIGASNTGGALFNANSINAYISAVEVFA
jgi:hypothetical protein